MTGGAYSPGGFPDIDGLFQQRARELDRRKREALLHRIQQLAHERVLYLPIYALHFNNGVGPRVQEPSLGRIPLHDYTASFEDLRLKGGCAPRQPGGLDAAGSHRTDGGRPCYA